MSVSFTALSLIFAAILAGLAYVFGIATVRQPDLWRKLPRERVVGEVIAVICLVWCTVHILPLLEGNMVRFRAWVRILAPILAVLSFFFLDYLFTRALGGLILLLINDLLHGAFTVHLPARPVFALVSYTFGIAALFLIGTPWRFRDLLEKCKLSVRWRSWSTGTLAAAALYYAVCGLIK
ncbi:MAG: hypothetical protein GXP31_13240 [Kiritimatiellaeota bacterium]|nr:hypothetical protein [Kiritimatiellota bacterium]